MSAPLELFSYIGFVRSRARMIALSCITATVLAAGISLLMPRQYTAASRIVIEPPAGTDPRAIVAVSPIYLESLKTYEQFASSDSLFQTAVDRFGIRAVAGNRSVESLKKSVLKIALLHSTRILEISATLPDPRKAQALAQFMAESTVDLSRSVAANGDRDLLQEMERQRQQLSSELDAADAAAADLAKREPLDSLQGEAENASILRSTVEEQLSTADLEVAEASSASDLANAKTRQREFQQQLQAIRKRDEERDGILAIRLEHRERLDAERKGLRTQLAGIDTQLREARGAAAFRGERLKIVDKGIVPERPSSPNLALNTAAAFLLGLALPLVWLALEFSYRQHGALRSLANVVDA